MLTNLPPQPSRIGRWRNEMAAADILGFEAISGPTLRELGYEVGSN